MIARMPLNGTKTHPLTPHAISMMRTLAKAPIPTQEINPGVVNRLTRGSPTEWLARIVMLPSPYRIHKGRNIAHLELTDAGIAALTNAND